MNADIVAGAVDLHVHCAPDVLGRKLDDIEMADRIRAVGMAGYCMKSHYFCTAERADLLNRIQTGCRAIGALVLNNTVGGLNPAAVELAARAGAKIVWMPTCDAAHEREHVFGPDADTNKKLPFWASIVIALDKEGVKCPPIAILDGDRLKAEVLEILEIVKKHDVVLATGHISQKESLALAREAKRAGYGKLMITHAAFPGTFFSIPEQEELVACGAMIEHNYTTYGTGKTSFDVIAAQIRAVGPEHVLISSDLGQPANVYPDEGILDFSLRLFDAGFTEREVRLMNRDNPLRLVS